MSEVSEAQKLKPSDAIARLEAAQKASGWLAWGGLGLAFLWWVAAIVGTIALIGPEALGEIQPALVVAGLIAIILPGLMLVLAGMMAREQARATAANAVVLESAARLLLPAETMAEEAKAFADEMSKASAEVDRSMGHALSAMKAMSAEIGDERQRLESVTYASADNARDLAERLGNERNGLEQLAKDLREQTDLLNEAIPEQADMMVASAKAAANEVGAAEDALQARLASLDQTGRSLAQKISAMDTLAAEAGERNETLLFAIARMEEKLEQSRKTVETAARAGELAAAAAGTTGDRLMESVKMALDGARDASSQIQNQTFEASESAARALAELKEAGQQAAAAVRAAGMAARAEMDIAERRATNTSQALLNKTKSVQARVTRTSKVEDDSILEPEAEIVLESETPPVVQSPSRAVEEDLFEASADRIAKAMTEETRSDAKSNGAASNGHDKTNGHADKVEETDPPKLGDKTSLIDLEGGVEITNKPRAGESLSDIIADMERDERSTLSREETAEALLSQLQDSGIKLTDIFRPKDKKRIAVAARKGEDQRRSATNQQVGRQVERVRQRLRGNLEMMTLARDFLALEESDALNALENTHASNKNASARLATYLLLDAAVT
ncbi:MAG: coiled-coil domain-containing protein [Henriciella sp.]